MNRLEGFELLRAQTSGKAHEIGRRGLVSKLALLGIAFAMVTFAPLSQAQQSDPGEYRVQLGETGQQPSIDSVIEAARADIRADRNSMIIAGMNFNDKEGAAFWPIYRKYEYERSTVEDMRAAVVKEYAEKYLTMSDADAKAMCEKMFEYDAREVELKKKYFKELNKVLPTMTVAKFFQLEHRIDLLVGIKIESSLPPLTARELAQY
jgi:hypothetical protein